MIESSGATLPKIAIDIGSTVVKLARLDDHGGLASQRFYPRDFDAGIARQVADVLAAEGIDLARESILGCSSANGGLRVGIVCLSKHFSGAALRNQVLLAGANPVFVHDFEEAQGDGRRVDLLLVGGGIDSDDAEPMRRRLAVFDPAGYGFSALVYCGNRQLASDFARRFSTGHGDRQPAGRNVVQPRRQRVRDRAPGVPGRSGLQRKA